MALTDRRPRAGLRDCVEYNVRGMIELAELEGDADLVEWLHDVLDHVDPLEGTNDLVGVELRDERRLASRQRTTPEGTL